MLAIHTLCCRVLGKDLAPVFRVYAPPAWILLQALHFQMPTAERFTLYFPQKLQKYLECWLTSIFLICLRREAPYRVPYLPTIPTFFVRLDIAASYLQMQHSISSCLTTSRADDCLLDQSFISCALVEFSGHVSGHKLYTWESCQHCWSRAPPYSVNGGLLSFDFSLGCFLLSFLQDISIDSA
jgi:hypothetical protein